MVGRLGVYGCAVCRYGRPVLQPPRAVLLLAVLLGITGCTDEGQGSATGTGVGLVAIPWWVFLVVLAVVLLLRRRRRR